MRVVLLVLATLIGSALGEVQQLPLGADLLSDYAGHQVWRLDWTSLSRDSQDVILDAIDVLQLDVWRKTPSALDVRFHPSDLPVLQRFIPASLPFAPFISDLSQLTSKKAAKMDIESWDVSSTSSRFHDEYHSLEDLQSFGNALVDGFNGVNGLRVEAFSFGETEEGRAIHGWKAWLEASEGADLRRKGKKGKQPKPPKTPKVPDGEEGGGDDDGGKKEEHQELEFVVQSGQHAREWVGPSTALYWFHDLLVIAANDSDSHVAQLLRSFTFTVIPTINPDGYVYSHEHSRLWRKNRQNTGSPICQGIDLNSNWGYKWRKSRASPCSDAFSGDHSLQAKEVSAMADYLANATSSQPGKTRKVRAFVDLHSYGQLFMFPFAYSCDDFPPDAEMLMEAGLGVAKAMRMGHGEGYQAGQACDLTYRAPGDAIDHVYGLVDTRWSYSAELRDTGTYGFMLPPSLIRPTGEEVSAGLTYLAKFIYNLERGI